MQKPSAIELFVLVSLAFVGIVGSLLWKYSHAGVTVIVSNATGGDVTNLQIKFTGGGKSAPKLKSAGSFETRVNPDGESHLDVEFADSSGKPHSEKVDVYIEHNHSGTIRVTLEPGGGVTWKDGSSHGIF